MTAPGGETIGRTFVEIWPSLRRWSSEFRAGTQQVNADVRRQMQGVERQVESSHRRILTRTASAVFQTTRNITSSISSTITGTVGTAAHAVSGVGKAVLLAGGAIATAAGAIGLKTAAMGEMSEVAFSQLLGGAKQAHKFMGDLSRFAAVTPFEMPGLVDAARQLIGAGEAAKDVIPTLTAWGNASGSLGITQENFNGIMLAVTQSMNKGKVQAEELMQITERGLPIYPLLARAMHKSVPELQKLASEGKLLSKDVFPALEKQMNKEYGGGLVKQSRTLLGLWSTVKDTFSQGMSRAIQPFLPLLKDALANGTTVLTNFFNWIPRKTEAVAHQARMGFSALAAAFSGEGITSNGFVGVMERIGVTAARVRTGVMAIFDAFRNPQYSGYVTQFSLETNVKLSKMGITLRTVRDSVVHSTKSIVLGVVGIFNAFRNPTYSGYIDYFTLNTNTKLSKVGITLRALFTAVHEVLSSVSAQFKAHGATTGGAVDYVTTKIGQLIDVLHAISQRGGGASETAVTMGSIADSFQRLTPAVQQFTREMPSLNDLLTVGARVLAFAADHVDTLITLMPAIVAGLVGFKVAQLGANVAQTLSIPTKIAEIVVNRQLVKSNRELIASRQGVTAAVKADTTARQANIFVAAVDRMKSSASGLTTVSGRVKASVTDVGGSVSRVAGTVGSLSGLGTRVRSAFGGIGAAIAGVVSSISPLGIALTGATLVLGYFIKKKMEGKARVEEFTAAIRADSGVIGENTRVLAARQLAEAGALEAAQKLGIDLRLVTDAVLGNANAQRQVTEKIHGATTATREQILSGQASIPVIAGNRDAASTLAGAMNQLGGDLSKTTTQQQLIDQASGVVTTTLSAQATQAGITGAHFRTLRDDLNNLVNTYVTAETTGLDFRDSLDAMSRSAKTNGTRLDETSTKGRENRRVVLASVDAAWRHAQALGNESGGEARARREFAASIPTIVDHARKIGLNERQVKALIERIAKLPLSKSVPITVYVRGVDATGVVGVGRSASGQPIGIGHVRHGGWVDGWSPHDTADNVPLMGTAEEFMVRRRSSRWWRRNYPGFLEWVNSAGRGVDVAGDAANTRIGIDKRLKFATGGSIASTQAKIRATDPLPYIWGAGGPRGYDCSGLVGAAYGDLTGRGGFQGQRYFTTDTIGTAQGFRPGLGTFSVGVTPGRGHMAGNLAGLGFEARSTASGIIIGSGATSPAKFARKFYLPQYGGTFMGGGGLTSRQIHQAVAMATPGIVRQVMRDAVIGRDGGGPLGPGQFAYNSAGGQERVLNSGETRAYDQRQELVTVEALRTALTGLRFEMNADGVVTLVNRRQRTNERKGTRR